MYKFSKKSLKALSGVDCRLQSLMYATLSSSPYDFGIPSTGGLRTSEEQNDLYKKGWSTKDGYNKKSYHQSGLAVDVALYDEHGLCYKCIDKYEEIADIVISKFKELRDIGVFPFDSYIRWGGDWNRNGVRVDNDPNEHFLDLPHFELRNLI